MKRVELLRYAAAAMALASIVGIARGLASTAPAATLRDPSAFSAIADPVARSRALFVEAGKVIQHARCLNCHPTDAHPRQGENLAFHQPPVVRGERDRGIAAMGCDTCHQDRNIDRAGLPGHPQWHLAPIESGWIGRSLGSICEQLKDPQRNGGRNLEKLHEHMASDSLVGWAWHPGRGRESAPGTQERFGKLIQAWIDTGAYCPDGEAGAVKGPEPKATADCATCH